MSSLQPDQRTVCRHSWCWWWPGCVCPGAREGHVLGPGNTRSLPTCCSKLAEQREAQSAVAEVPVGNPGFCTFPCLHLPAVVHYMGDQTPPDCLLYLSLCVDTCRSACAQSGPAARPFPGQCIVLSIPFFCSVCAHQHSGKLCCWRYCSRCGRSSRDADSLPGCSLMQQHGVSSVLLVAVMQPSDIGVRSCAHGSDHRSKSRPLAGSLSRHRAASCWCHRY